MGSGLDHVQTLLRVIVPDLGMSGHVREHVLLDLAHVRTSPTMFGYQSSENSPCVDIKGNMYSLKLSMSGH
jgi:hypothetical protein